MPLQAYAREKKSGKTLSCEGACLLVSYMPLALAVAALTNSLPSATQTWLVLLRAFIITARHKFVPGESAEKPAAPVAKPYQLPTARERLPSARARRSCSG